MILQGHFKHAWQHENLAQYAEVVIEIKTPGNGELNLNAVPDQLKSSATFGIQLARETLHDILTLNADIRIRDFQWQPCDTTTMATAYVVFKAIQNALKIDDENLFLFNESSGEYRIKYPMQ